MARLGRRRLRPHNKEDSVKLINKTELVYRGGYLVDPGTDEIVAKNSLAQEINELVELRDLNEFLVANETAILAQNEGVVYSPVKHEGTKPITSGTEPETPLRDADVEKSKALAEEWLNVQTYKDVNTHLARYRSVAGWLKEELTVVVPAAHMPTKFNVDPFELVESDVIDIVEAYHSPTIAKLRGLVTIDFS